MKKLLIPIIFLSLYNGLLMSVRGQQVVFDPVVTSTLVVNHIAQQSALESIKNNESEIATAQKLIALQVTSIKELDAKMYGALKDISAVVAGAKDLVYAANIAEDIGAYQVKMSELAINDPKLLLVAVKTEQALVKRTADLFTYMYFALIGGDINLLNNKQRLDFMTHVVKELRIMRGIAYGVYRRMKLAKRAGVLNGLNYFGLKIPNRGPAIVDRILKDIKYVTK